MTQSSISTPTPGRRAASAKRSQTTPPDPGSTPTRGADGLVRDTTLTTDIGQASTLAVDPIGAEDITTLPPGTAAWFTVLIPTRNEESGVAALLHALAEAAGEIPLEVLFVDDSTDQTPEAIRRAARECGLAVRLLHRPLEHRSGGLAGAVVAGLRQARGSWAVVMDADLQHPPEVATRMVAIGQARRLDLVVGTRYVEGGEASGLAGGYRRVVSGLSTKLAKGLFPSRLARISDPMSGLFAVRLAALDLDRLNPLGFKVLLEIAVRQHPLRVAEVPFTFGTRLADTSKASAQEGVRYLRHLARLRLGVLKDQVKRSSTVDPVQRMLRLLAFGLVGASGLAVNEAALWLFSQQWNHHYLVGAILATEVSTAWNFSLTEAMVFRGTKPGSVVGRGVRFALVNHLALLLRLPLLALLVEVLGLGVLVGNFITLALLFLARFVVVDSAIYAPAPEVTPVPQPTEPAPARTVIDLTTPALELAPELPGPAKDPMRLVVHLPSLRPVPDLTSHREHSPVDEAPPPVPHLPTQPQPVQRRSQGYLPYRYSIDGIATVGSQVPLRELEYFRAQWVGQDVDLAIRVGNVGDWRPRRRAVMTQYVSPPALSYQEHLGRLGANFRVEIGEPVRVTCSRALANSPHVLYTNVIEALLRFIAVERGVILLHSACLELDGQGILLSARTDTGKTGTVLRLLREHGARFLSDDMTIVSPTAEAMCFPKPLTISHHTLRAVQVGDLTAAEWRRLRLQSRLHSKEGRGIGMALAGMNIPIMGVNSLTQRLVPPPKYVVDR
ncbi:MAG: glycosyltransferase, partial [Actinomycetales bacterium]